MTSDSRSWPLPEERRSFATASPVSHSRKVSRSAWVLTALAFLCGVLVSAAAFSVGWRHQAQRDTAARTALAASRTHVQQLERALGGLRGSLQTARRSAATAIAAQKALARTGAQVSEEATVAGGDGEAISSGAGSLTTTAKRVAGELKTLDTYLTTTPAGQLDPGYVASQTAYLSRQVSRLQDDAGGLASSVASFETTLGKLGTDAKTLQRR